MTIHYIRVWVLKGETENFSFPYTDHELVALANKYNFKGEHIEDSEVMKAFEFLAEHNYLIKESFCEVKDTELKEVGKGE